MLTLHFAPQSRAVRIAWLFAELDLDYNLNAMRFLDFGYSATVMLGGFLLLTVAVGCAAIGLRSLAHWRGELP